MARHRSPDERRRHVDAWRHSQMTQSAYARHIGVDPQTLAKWARDNPLRPPAFIEVATTSYASEVLAVTVAGCDLTFVTPPPPEWFAAVLRAASLC